MVNFFAELPTLLWILIQWPLVALADKFGFLWKKEKDISKVRSSTKICLSGFGGCRGSSCQ